MLFPLFCGKNKKNNFPFQIFNCFFPYVTPYSPYRNKSYTSAFIRMAMDADDANAIITYLSVFLFSPLLY